MSFGTTSSASRASMASMTEPSMYGYSIVFPRWAAIALSHGMDTSMSLAIPSSFSMRSASGSCPTNLAHP